MEFNRRKIRLGVLRGIFSSFFLIYQGGWFLDPNVLTEDYTAQDGPADGVECAGLSASESGMRLQGEREGKTSKPFGRAIISESFVYVLIQILFVNRSY